MRKLLMASSILASLAATASAQTPAPISAAHTSLSVGVFDSISGFTVALGQAPTLYDCYVDSTKPRAQWLASGRYAASNCGDGSMTPALGMPMAAPDDASADASFKSFIAGNDDDYITGTLAAFKAAGYNGLYLRPGWEMNGTWFKWATTPDNAADFVAAFQHIARVAKSYAQANGMIVEIVWNPNAGPSSATMEELYPSDGSVDVVGLDAYGAPVWNDSFPLDPPSTGNNISMQGIMQFAMQHNKPFALPETGGSNAAYVNNLAQGLQTIPAEKIAFIIIWDSNAAGCSGCLIAPGSDLANAWKALIAQAQQQGVFLPNPTVTQPTPTAPIGIDTAPPSQVAADLPSATAANVPAAPSGLNADIASLQAEIARIAADLAQLPATSQVSAATFSPNNTTVKIGDTGGITDAAGNVWTITPGGQVAINGVVDPITHDVTMLAYVNGTIWQRAWHGLWWGETFANGWDGTQGVPTSPLPSSGTPAGGVIGFDPGPILGHRRPGRDMAGAEGE